MKNVYICSKFAGVSCKIVDKYKHLARVYCRIAWDKGYFPIAPQLYLPLFLDNENTSENRNVAKLSLKALEQCAEVWVFGEVKTAKMRNEIERAAELNIPVKYYRQYGEEV